jgi:hypothetical protein
MATSEIFGVSLMPSGSQGLAVSAMGGKRTFRTSVAISSPSMW